MNQSNDNESTNDISVPQPVDSVIEVSISSNKLEASIIISPPENGGIGPNIQTMKEALNKHRVIHGVNVKTLLEISKEPKYNESIKVAQGSASISGTDGSFQLHFDNSVDSKPKERADGSIDFFNFESNKNIKENQKLCTIILPKDGTNGITVLGDTIPFIKGKAVPPMVGKNTKLSEDGVTIISTIEGQAEYTQGKINIFDTLFIKGDVDSITGNINVLGNVIVNGTVLAGFIVKASGNIQIQGGLSAVKLVAGGDIILRSGIIGGNITCDGDLTSRFIESCKVFVKGNITTDYIMSSNVKCGKNLHAINAISKIVGGQYLVGENIQANTIGSNANIPTYLELGTDPETILRQQELIKEIPPLETKKESLESLIFLLKQFEASNRLTLEKKQMLDNALSSYNETVELIDSYKLELDKITESIKLKGYGRVICKGVLHSGTTVKIGSVQTTIKDTMFSKSLYYSSGGILIGNL